MTNRETSVMIADPNRNTHLEHNNCIATSGRSTGSQVW